MYNILTHWRVLINSFTVSELCPALTIVLFEADGHQSHQNTRVAKHELWAACQFQKHWKTSSGLVTLYCVHSSWELCVNICLPFFIQCSDLYVFWELAFKNAERANSCLTIFSQHPPTNKRVSLFMSKCTITSKQFTTIFRIPWPIQNLQAAATN